MTARPQVTRILILLGLLVTGCTATPAPIASVAPRWSHCQGAVDLLSAPPADLEVVLDAVALPTKTTLQANDSGVSGKLFAKQGLVIRAGATVELVPGAQVPNARVAWPPLTEIGSGARHEPCTGVTGWLAYVGGYYVDAPVCLPLKVTTAGRDQIVGIPVGVPC